MRTVPPPISSHCDHCRGFMLMALVKHRMEEALGDPRGALIFCRCPFCHGADPPVPPSFNRGSTE